MDLIISTIFGLVAIAWWGVVGGIFLVLGLIFLLGRFLRAHAQLAVEEAKKAAKFLGFPIDVKIFPKLKKRLGKPKADFRSFYNHCEEKIYKKTCWLMRLEMAPFIKKGERVLDVGSGRGYIAWEIQERLKAKVTAVDVVDLGKTGMAVVLFDGKKLPFAENSFEVVIFSYVLHHAGPNQRELLREAKRVSKSRVIIFEDEAVGGFGELFTSCHRFAYDFLNDIKGNNACVFHSVAEWEKIFKRMGFKVLEKQIGWTIGSIISPVKRSFWVLGVESKD